MQQTIATTSLVIAAAILISCSGAAMVATAQEGDDPTHRPMPPFVGVEEVVAVVHPTAEGEAHGTVHFRQHDDGRVTMTARIEGLNPNQNHGFHVHEFGDCTADDATSAGSHYNPDEHPHGIPNGDDRHAGDFGNLEANDEGVAELEVTVDNISIVGTHNPVIGRAVIVHAEEDDGGQPLGNAGGRIGCGVIGVAQDGGR